ncbi:MAG: DUF6807 family protein [Armatimonadota bacterium]
MRAWLTAVSAAALLVGAAAWSAVAMRAVVFRGTATVKAGDSDRENTPVYADVKLPEALAGKDVEELSASMWLARRARRTSRRAWHAQVARPEGLPEDTVRAWWILPAGEAGAETQLGLTVYTAGGLERPPEVASFAWQDTPGDHLDLLYEGRPVLRYMYAFDPENMEQTKKPFHHVFSPDGQRLITKGPGGKYSHHRGLFIGWNRTEYDGKRADFWHCTNGVHQRHVEFLEQTAGRVFARSAMRINWNDAEGEPVVEEQRTVTVFQQPQPWILIEFVSTLTSKRGTVKLNGDLHHAGFQFRADNEVTTREAETNYIFPTDEMKTAELPKEPWVAMSFALGDERFTVLHMNHTDNPAETTYSDTERRYGRFGAFFTHDLKADEPLTVKYRLMVHQGAEPPSAEALHQRYMDFVDPPEVVVAPAE